MTALWLAAALPAVPALAGLAGLLLPERSRRVPAGLGIGASGLVFLAALALAVRELREPAGSALSGAAPLARFGSFTVSAAISVGAVAALVAVAVGAVAFAVQVYSTGYLAHDERYAPYAAQVSLFTAAMMLVVVSDDLIVLLVGWEVMGLCSYLLIGHDRSLPEAPGAAVKAFLVTRAGDVGFLLGIAVLGTAAGSFRIPAVLSAHLGAGTLTLAGLLLLAGVAGKSAQFPLHTWLPDAMAGPTPISALIHAATMVAAGVYVVARLYPVFTPATLTVLGVMASITMLLGALAALAQDDIKRVLAWSTVSQLGYMTGGLAVHGPDASLFHLLSHAAFKALLFLAAGAVIHAVGTNLMSGMGGLRRSMPVTFAVMTIGLGALAGIPPLAGFWSKDSILTAAEEWATAGHWTGWLVLVTGLLTVAVTGAYVVRLWLGTFFGSGPAGHDPPPSMRWPLVGLAVPSALLGFAALAGHRLPILPTEGWFAYAPLNGPLPGPDLAPGLVTAVLGVALSLGGGAVTWALWRRGEDPFAVPILRNAFYLDEVQDRLVTRPVLAMARLARRADAELVDGAVEGGAAGVAGIGALLGRAHGPGLGRYATAVLGGGALLAAVVVASGVLHR
ncbi:MAG: NADH-ubiquinone oxidoreductase chain [Actinomycetia bacterium]|nr:NADH-ubiquinone oxidoreductase chain [Actinomycetes bacterium]